MFLSLEALRKVEGRRWKVDDGRLRVEGGKKIGQKFNPLRAGL
jgi:hypothetical protein